IPADRSLWSRLSMRPHATLRPCGADFSPQPGFSPAKTACAMRSLPFHPANPEARLSRDHRERSGVIRYRISETVYLLTTSPSDCGGRQTTWPLAGFDPGL